MTLGLWRVDVEGRVQLARGDTATGPTERLSSQLSITDFLTDDGTLFGSLATLATEGNVPAARHILAPLDRQPVWAAGVTFPRSRDARKEEARDGGDVYERVYDAERPELFFKSMPESVVGPHDVVGIRTDSTWDVPEPELAVVGDSRGEIRAVTLGNDMSSRSIEGDNPLYLPQAKIYDRSCALGPALVPIRLLPDWDVQSIQLVICRKGALLYRDSVDVTTMRRRPTELLRWLFRANEFPAGVVLLTGTSIVPPADLTLMAGDTVEISTSGLGTLANTVSLVGRD